MAQPLKRHPALQDLSRDHHKVLLHAREIAWAVERDPHARPLEDVTRSLIEFWEGEGLLHLREEEEILIPLYAAKGSVADAHIAELLQDHEWLRARMKDLKQQFSSGNRDCESLLVEIGRRLHDHVRFEERVVFQRFQELLSDAELAELWEQSLLFRRRWRSADAIGPYRAKRVES